VGGGAGGNDDEAPPRRQATTVSAVKSLLHRARATLAHQAGVPAFAAPFLARLARVRPGQIVVGMLTEHATGAAAIATVAIAGTSALGSLHAPAPPQAPTATQANAALVAAARQPRHAAPAPKRSAPAKTHACDTLCAEYGTHADSAAAGGAEPAPRDERSEYGP
jgi:hypothetical protein